MKDDSLYSVDRFYFHPFLLLKPLLWSFFHAKVDLNVFFSILWSFFNALLYLFNVNYRKIMILYHYLLLKQYCFMFLGLLLCIQTVKIEMVTFMYACMYIL